MQNIYDQVDYPRHADNSEQPDHPHQAAIHLMQALKCCKDCAEPSQADLLELRELEYRKELLAEELKTLTYRGDSVLQLQT